MSRVVIVRAIFIFTISWTIWFLFHFAKSGSTDILSEMMLKFSTAIDSSYDSSRLVYTAVIAVGFCTYNWIDLLLPFVIDVCSLISVAIGPLYRFLSPAVVFLSRHVMSIIQRANDQIEWKYKIGISVFLLLFFRVGRFLKVFLSNLIFFIFTFDFLKPVLSNDVVRTVMFVVAPVVLAIQDISRKEPLISRSANLIGYLSILPVLIYIDGLALVESKNAQFFLCPIWAGIVSLMLCLNSRIRITSFSIDRLVDDLGISAFVNKCFVPIVNRIGHALVSKYPIFGRIPDSIASIQSRIFSVGLKFSSGQYNVTSIIRGKWSFVSVVIISLILLGYFAYTALSLFVSIAVWPWFFSESYKILKLEVVSEYRSHLSFILLFLIYEFFLVRSKFAIVAFIASMLHLPALLMLKVLSSTLISRLVDTVRALSPAPSPTTSPQPSPKKND